MPKAKDLHSALSIHIDNAHQFVNILVYPNHGSFPIAILVIASKNTDIPLNVSKLFHDIL